MARGDVLHDSPRSKKLRGEQIAKKGDVEEFDGEEFESIGEKYLDKADNIKGDVDEDELKASMGEDEKGRMVRRGKGWDDIRYKDSEGGRRREYFKRKPAKPTS